MINTAPERSFQANIMCISILAIRGVIYSARQIPKYDTVGIRRSGLCAQMAHRCWSLEYENPVRTNSEQTITHEKTAATGAGRFEVDPVENQSPIYAPHLARLAE